MKLLSSFSNMKLVLSFLLGVNGLNAIYADTFTKQSQINDKLSGFVTIGPKYLVQGITMDEYNADDKGLFKLREIS